MDVASVDVIWNGFHQSKKIADLAETFEVNCAPHNYYSHLATFVAAQWCAAIPNARILEFDVDDVPWRDELVTALPEIADGELRRAGWPRLRRRSSKKVLRAASLARIVSLPGGLAAAAAGLLLLEAAVRLAAGAPYPGATVLLLASLRARRSSPSCRASSARRRSGSRSCPRSALGSFSLLLTTVSIVGIELTELSIRLSVAVLALVLVAAAVTRVELAPTLAGRAARESPRSPRSSGSSVSRSQPSYDIVEPFPPPGTDWAHNLQYADEVEAQGALLIDDPYRPDEPSRLRQPVRSRRALRQPPDRRRRLLPLARARHRRRLGAPAALPLRGRRRAVRRGRGSRWPPPLRRGADPAGDHVLARPRDDARPRLRPARDPRARAPPSREPGSRTVVLLGLALASVGAMHSASGLVVAIAVAPGPRSLFRLLVRPTGRDGLGARASRCSARGGRSSGLFSARARSSTATAGGGSRLSRELPLLRPRVARPRHPRLLLLVAVPRARRGERR